MPKELKKEEKKLEKNLEKDIKKEDPKLKRDTKKFAYDVKKQVVTAWTAALGLVLALAWNSVFQSFFKSITDTIFKHAPAYLAPILSASLTTILVVIGIIILNRWASKPPKVPENNK